MSKQTKKPCIYCGGLTNGNVCGNCVRKIELVRIIKKMVINKAEEVGYFERRGIKNGIQKKR